jgi:hypothetical protein
MPQVLLLMSDEQLAYVFELTVEASHRYYANYNIQTDETATHYSVLCHGEI